MAASLLKETEHTANEINFRKHGEIFSVVLLHYLYVLVRKMNSLYVQETPEVILYEARHFEDNTLLHVFMYGLTSQETPNSIPLRLVNSHNSQSCNRHALLHMRLCYLPCIRASTTHGIICLSGFFSHDLLM